jgi:hypothetical protein
VSRRDSLLRRVAWRLQVLAGGDLSERARQRAAEIANDAELRRLAPRDFLVSKSGNERGAGASRHTGDRRIPPPGTVLTRQYKDALIRVMVLREGVECEGHGYKSLSAVAMVKTGTRWNGIVFFGLHRMAGVSGMATAEATDREPVRAIRCAIYTRKFTEQGLAQDFNSLDAQREAAEAYILSQRELGWTVLPDRYDDGGFTGGNLERPRAPTAVVRHRG